MRRRGVLLSAGLLLVAGCSGGEQPGALSRDEERQLNDAAAMLDANSVTLDAVTTNEDD
jgi:ABC-type glycerol-3-phosphate transport system substrate-binding protein